MTKEAPQDDPYGNAIPDFGAEQPAPEFAYGPADPKNKDIGIGLIGCGGITRDHLRAYRSAGYDVLALCDVVEERAQNRRDDFFPRAAIYSDYKELLRRDDIAVVDIATHPEQRIPLVEAALNAGKHVLSQKPFVVDLDLGERLVELAQRKNVLLAVNQNGRWAPHLAYLREAVHSGWLGTLYSAHAHIHWDHSWIAGTEFEKVKHLILYDFGIHWFDFICTLARGNTAKRVFASTCRTGDQVVAPSMQAQALIEFDDWQASLAFDGYTRYGAWDSTYVAGSVGTAHSFGPDLKAQNVRLYNAQGYSSPKLRGAWFPDAFHGTMGELLRAIEENRQPSHSAANNLTSLALCFAAIASAETGQSVRPGTIRKLPTFA